MSVILDALRRAEGERELAHVPTPTTAHEEAAETKRRALPWILACALVTSAAGLLLVWLDPPARGGRPSREAEPRAISSPAAESAHVPPEQPSRREAQTRASSSEESAPHAAAAKSWDVADMTLPGSLRRRGPAPIRAAGPPDPQPTGARVTEPRVQVFAREQDPPPQASAPRPVTASVPMPGRAVSAPAVPPLADTAGNRADPTPPPGQSAAVPGTHTPPSGLHEAVAHLTLNVLVYSEDAAERTVFIGGQRYVEGERVDGLFLVQEIRPEGVLLSRQGEQALLRLAGRSR